MPVRTVVSLLTTIALSGLVLTVAPAAAAPSCLGKAATIVGTSAGETLNGTAADDVIVGGGGKDKIYGMDGNDTLCGGGGNDLLVGGNGSDRMDGGGGGDVMNGGPGFDWADYRNRRNAVNAKIDKVAADGEAGEGDKVTKTVEGIVGGKGADTLIGNKAANVLIGGARRDTLKGARGDDTLFGGGGGDRVNGDVDDDLLVGGPGKDKMDGGGFDDVITQFNYTTVTSTDSPTAISDDGGNNDFFIDLPAGEIRDINVRVDIQHGSPSDLRLQLRSPDLVFMTLSDGVTNNGTQLTGTTFDSEAFRNVDAAGARPLSGRFHPLGSLDRKYRGTEANGTWRLRITDASAGTAGTLNWWAIDVAYATDGTDGADVIMGGEGIHDLVDYSARTTRVRVSLDGGTDDGAIGEGDSAGADLEEVITGSGNDDIVGNAAKNDLRAWTGDDTVSGQEAHDEIRGQAGNDTLYGNKGGDDVDGDEGDDTIFGGEGDDNLDGGPGTDTIDGGPGTNTCTNGENLSNCA